AAGGEPPAGGRSRAAPAEPGRRVPRPHGPTPRAARADSSGRPPSVPPPRPTPGTRGDGMSTPATTTATPATVQAGGPGWLLANIATVTGRNLHRLGRVPTLIALAPPPP